MGSRKSIRQIISNSRKSEYEFERIQKELLAKCKLIQPSYTPIVDVAQYKEKNILVVWCFGGQTRPYKCPTTLDKDFSKGYSII